MPLSPMNKLPLLPWETSRFTLASSLALLSWGAAPVVVGGGGPGGGSRSLPPSPSLGAPAGRSRHRRGIRRTEAVAGHFAESAASEVEKAAPRERQVGRAVGAHAGDAEPGIPIERARDRGFLRGVR